MDGAPINGGPWCINVNAAGNSCLEFGGLLAINGQFYNNSNSRNGAYQNYLNTASDYVKLGPGTYIALFAAQMAIGSTIGAGAAKLYLGSGKDDLQIIAHYVLGISCWKAQPNRVQDCCGFLKIYFVVGRLLKGHVTR
ncbi:MAG: hypothetical protein JKY22_09400 [Flavobacteriaceae bacterium]|nr:hypothetical protein [Flavobacteriaceae bacterium]